MDLAVQSVAAGRRVLPQCGAHLSAFRDFAAGLLQVEAAVRRTWRGGPVRSPAARRTAHRGRRRRTSSARSCICGNTYHFGPGRIADYLKRFHQIAVARSTVHRILGQVTAMNRLPAESEASAASRAVAAVREAAAGPPAAARREVPRAHSRHPEAALSVHRDRRLHAHSRAQGLRRVQSAHRDPVHRRRPCTGCRSAST